jgi:hypothetical protein
MLSFSTFRPFLPSVIFYCMFVSPTKKTVIVDVVVVNIVNIVLGLGGESSENQRVWQLPTDKQANSRDKICRNEEF